MENLIEYTRLVFEERYMVDKAIHETYIDCTEYMEDNICIPGALINYMMLLYKSCYKNFKDKAILRWNGAYRCFFCRSSYNGDAVAFNLKSEEDNQCYFDNALCTNMCDEFSRVKVRMQQRKDIENLLIDIIYWGKDVQAIPCIVLFSKIIKSNIHIFPTLIASLKSIFKVLLFLFPSDMLKEIKQMWEDEKMNKDFKSEILSILSSYQTFILKVSKDMNTLTGEPKWTRVLNEFYEYTGFQLFNLQRKYDYDLGDTCSFKDLITFRFHAAYKDYMSEEESELKSIIAILND